MNKRTKPFKIKAIVFDFDGVLVESVSVKADAFGDLYAHAGEEIQSKVMKHHHAHGGLSRYDKIRHYETEFLGKPPGEDKVQHMATRFSHLVESKVIASAWVAGAKEFLEATYEIVPLFVASATPEDELKRIISARHMNKYFQAVYGSPVKKEEHLKTILQDHEWQGKDVLMIGDAMSDYNAAKANGTNFVGRHDPATDFIFPAGTITVSDLKELPDLIEFIT